MSYISFKLCNKKRVFKKVRIFEILFLECLLCAVRDGFRKFGHNLSFSSWIRVNKVNPVKNLVMRRNPTTFDPIT